ncbi:hypothetical protein [Celeribacter indicus]|uniref:Uncharacterized protein n=1 Tax=Celeribacter indicus TaxID=1208324 RepID=A0A0B5E2X4_9RHOB|nr:hypothetical protein [Celeribacter indicus]AJE46802.1 hypothetical protein P73_2087 [Celeribacter indicus]SDW81571.1 N-terminal domain of uncharacterized protein YciW-containing protein [Celeribacter indicus]
MPRTTAGLSTTLASLPLDKGLRRAVERQQEALGRADRSEADLLSPEHAGPVSRLERRAIALHVAAIHREQELIDRYHALLAATEGAGTALAHLVEAEAQRDAARPAPTGHALPDERLAQLLAHVRALLEGDRQGRSALLALDAEAAGIVSRILALVVFEARVIGGLRQCALARRSVNPPAPKGYTNHV